MKEIKTEKELIQSLNRMHKRFKLIRKIVLSLCVINVIVALINLFY